MVFEVILSGLSINTIVGEEEAVRADRDTSREDQVLIGYSRDGVDGDCGVDRDCCGKEEEYLEC
jgi:hypothetical protein